MGFGRNRYLTLLAALGLGLALTSGCSKSSNNGPTSGSTTAATTSSTIAPTTSGTTTNTGPGPTLTFADFVDADGNSRASKGDSIVLTFDGEVAPIPAGLDPSAEFTLPVAGDSLGTGATVTNGASSREVEVTLGDMPLLHVSEAFDPLAVTAGDSSGINVAFGTSNITGVGAGSVQPATDAVDVITTLVPGFYAAPAMNVARGGHVSVSLDDGRVLVVGGISGGAKPEYIADAEVFDPVTDSWSVVGRMKRSKVDVRMTGATATKLKDGKVLICGGYGVERETSIFLFLGNIGIGAKKAKIDTLKSAFVFDPANDSFTRVGDMRESRHSHTATLMADGRVLVAGGYNDSIWKSKKTEAPFEVFDPARGSFSKVSGGFLGLGSIKTEEDRMNHTATAIEGGSGVLLSGGNHWSGGGLFGLFKPKLKMTKGSEVIRDAKKAERQVDMNDPRFHHAAAAITPTSVLVAGGQNDGNIVESVEVYDVASNRWASKGKLSTPRTGVQIAIERSRALIIGGHNGAAESGIVESFDVASGKLLPTTLQLQAARNNFTTAVLKDGTVLVIGGMTASTKSLQSLDGQAMAGCEVYVRP